MRSESESRGVRRPRLRRRAATPGALAGVVAAALVGIAAIALGSWALSATGDPGEPTQRMIAAPAVEPTATVTAGMVEVPALIGLSLEEAETVLAGAGMAVQVRPEDPNATGDADTVVGQEPAAGVLADADTTVVVVVRSSAPTATTSAPPKKPQPKRPDYVVVIDPGHQARSNSAPEPIGPGATEVKPKVSGGATGVKTRIPEYEIVLQISSNLKKRLEAQGMKVVMTRSTNDVNLSNSERADIANRAKADLFVRVHGDGSPDSKTTGISTLYPGKNRWTKRITGESKQAAKLVQAAVIGATGAVDRGIVARQDLSGFNYAKVPSILVETGFLSNSVEDRLLSSPHYQDKVAQGMAAGIMSYLEASGSR